MSRGEPVHFWSAQLGVEQGGAYDRSCRRDRFNVGGRHDGQDGLGGHRCDARRRVDAARGVGGDHPLTTSATINTKPALTMLPP